jgi:hypothetical protein
MTEKPKCKLIGEDGNIFNLMAKAQKALERANMKKASREMVERIWDSESYSNALSIISEYVEIV